MRKFRRSKRFGLIGLLALLAAGAFAALALASELNAELDGGGQVEVNQGASNAPFTIKLSASGALECGKTATATVPTSYEIDASGNVSNSGTSAPISFTGSGAALGGSGNCEVQGGGSVAATVSVAAATATGPYAVNVPGTTDNTGIAKGKLEDEFSQSITVNVSAAGGGAVDTTAPVISITTPADGASFLLNQNVLADYACTDNESTVTQCAGPVADGAAIDTASVGSKSFRVDAASAGGTSFMTHNYSVAYDFSGLFAPIDRPTTLNVSKAGQAIPLKWRLTDANGAAVTNLSSVKVTVASRSCALGTTTDEVEEYAAGSSGLQNLGDGYYQFNWKSPTTYANSCKTLSLDLGEGAARTVAYVQFKK